ncbi:uncharacterized protein LACBIDRAFT_333742 [Laccaria bicolor S238N-H82]|uniref:Predicted protein n=1 Tax=Laccaria bicolor (strain S238N-H82 / ATCC MYA-4686) TaxID=486041 RepID=B0DWX5_LACBS|nr:uncharacterized protein LACBIDRAFT_333742 [Laccaria bicolor S238N-H82]EDR00887.1 predicted protein [Laccaria bicolor S238N-H82]|eukprot:XP_001888481.1 predicted protein [Laccaria bicolor S238N-H82]
MSSHELQTGLGDRSSLINDASQNEQPQTILLTRPRGPSTAPQTNTISKLACANTTAKPTSSKLSPLNKHWHILDRAPSLNSLASAELKILPERKRRGGTGCLRSLLPKSLVQGAAAAQLQSSPQMGRPSASSVSPGSRAWYEFDLAVVVALVSPIGNWLTGGDHIKNLLLIILLIFYLHQIIEIHWDLYQKSRLRRRSPSLPPLPDSTEPPSYRTYAASDLRSFELSLLFLTFLSPFLGALCCLLRYATAAVSGPQSVSWFSMGLFRISHGTSSRGSALVRRDCTICDLEKRVLELERKLGKMGKRVGGVVDEVHEYVDEAVDGVWHSLKKQERRWEKWEGRVREVEEKVNKSPSAPERGRLSLDGAYAHSLLAYVLPQWLLDFEAPYYTTGLYYGPSLYSPTTTSTIASRHHHHHHQHYQHPSFPSSPSTLLETIVEEDDSTTAVNGKCQEKERYRCPFLARPMWITSSIIMRVGYLLMAPLRAVVRMVLRRQTFLSLPSQNVAPHSLFATQPVPKNRFLVAIPDNRSQKTDPRQSVLAATIPGESVPVIVSCYPVTSPNNRALLSLFSPTTLLPLPFPLHPDTVSPSC